MGLLVAVVIPDGASARSPSCQDSHVDTPLVSAVNCDDLRPGAFFQSSSGMGTIGFLLRGSDRRLYFAAAGHSFVNYGVTKVWKRGAGPGVQLVQGRNFGVENSAGIPPLGRGTAQPGAGRRIGEAAYASYAPDGLAHDFALIRVDPKVAASAAIAHWGGPTSLFSKTGVNAVEEPKGAQPVTYRVYGQGIGVAAAVPARSLAGYPPVHQDFVLAAGSVTLGDSGAPVIVSDGRAVGIVVHGSSVSAYGGGNVMIVRLGPALQRAQKALRIRLSLVSAPVRQA